MSDRGIPKYAGPKPSDRMMTRDEIRKRFDNEIASIYSRQDPAYLPDYAVGFELLIDCVLQEMAETGRHLRLRRRCRRKPARMVAIE